MQEAVRIGKRVVLEGPDGTGKTTQVEKIQDKLSDTGVDSIRIREPGGNATAESIRVILLDPSLYCDGMTNLLLFTAARRSIWLEVARPALELGKWVVADRCWLSTLAYQGYGEGIDLSLIENITEKAVGEGYVHPEICLILSTEERLARLGRIAIRNGQEKPDAFESKMEEFHERVHDGYIKIAKDYNIPLINADKTIPEVTDDIWQYIQPLI